ncbi:thiamine pyrophosphate-binding protein [Streptomyces sp. NPDC054765]
MVADGYARASEKFGAVIALDGPGVANTVGGLVNTNAERSPVLLLSGHIPTGFDAHDALQGVTPTGLDMAAMLTPVTSSSLQARSAVQPIRYWNITLKKLVECPTRPAYLSYPADVLFAETAEPAVRTRTLSTPRLMCAQEELDRTIATISASASVAVLVGSNANKRDVRALLTRLSESHAVLVGSTVDAKGAFPESHPNNVGVFGYSGILRAIDRFTRQPPETVLLGCRPSQWNTNAWGARLSGARNVIEVTSSIEDIGNFAVADTGGVGSKSAERATSPDGLRAMPAASVP